VACTTEIDAATSEEGVLASIVSTVNQVANSSCKNTKSGGA